FRAAGVRMGEPTPMTRERPDGYLLRWVLSVAPEGQRGVAPFLVEDATPRAERVRGDTAHPNSATGVGTLTVAVDAVATVRHWYASALAAPGREVARPDLEAAGVAFKIGPHAVELLAPTGASGPLADWLAARGPSPYAATLLAPTGRPGPLDPTKTLG